MSYRVQIGFKNGHVATEDYDALSEAMQVVGTVLTTAPSTALFNNEDEDLLFSWGDDTAHRYVGEPPKKKTNPAPIAKT